MSDHAAWVGHRIRQARREMNLSQAQLGERIGARQQLVARWERGVMPASHWIPQITAALGIDASALLALPGTRRPQSDVEDLPADERVRVLEERLDDAVHQASRTATRNAARFHALEQRLEELERRVEAQREPKTDDLQLAAEGEPLTVADIDRLITTKQRPDVPEEHFEP